MPTSSPAASAAAPVAGLGWRNPHFLLFLSAVLWGMTWPAARTMALHLPPISSASWRFTLACIPMLAMVYLKNKGWPALSGRQYRWLALSGVIGVVGYMVCFMWGLSLVPAGRGSLVITFNPVITAIGAAIFLRERISARMLLGMAVATLGALTVITHGEFSRMCAGGVGKGELILLGCSFTWGAYSLMSKRSMQFTDSLTATTYPIVLGTLVFYGYGLGYFEQLPRAWQVPFVLAVFALQVLFSHLWLRKFRFGPMEWLWRSLTYATPQPMRLQAT